MSLSFLFWRQSVTTICYHALSRGLAINVLGISPSLILTADALNPADKWNVSLSRVSFAADFGSRSTFNVNWYIAIFVMPPTIDIDEPSVDEANAAPPDGGYGWVCVVSLFLVNFSTWGAVAVCSTSTQPMLQ